MKYFKHGLMALVTLLTTGAANAAFVNVGETNGTANTATGIVDGNRITTDQRWTRDNVYLLRRVIIIDDGATLTIEPGTIIRGVTTTLSGFTAEPGALLIARGGKIVANGTADDPIIFTSIDDPNVPGDYNTIPTTFTSAGGTATTVKDGSGFPVLPENDYSGDGPEGDNGFSKSARWGGVVICGRGYVAQGTGATDTNSDGIWDDHNTSFSDSSGSQNSNIGADYPEGMSTNLTTTIYNAVKSLYGGLDDNDNSGVMRFVSIRYGGFVLGDPSVGNEINSLTICGVGMGTVLEHIESYQNQDDGFEWFGGKSNSRFMFSMSNQDDCFDGDEGHRGTHQFWVAAQGTINDGTSASLRSGYDFNERIGQDQTGTDYRYDKLFEWDGPEADNADRLPKTDIKVYNATLLAGDTQKRGLQIRLEAQATLYNAVVERASAVSQATTSGTNGTITSMLSWSNLHSFTTVTTGAAEIGTVSAGSPSVTVLTQLTALTEESASQIATSWFPSGFTAVPLYTKNGFNPTLASGAAARTEDGTAAPAGFVDALYAGALRDNNHLFGWSTLNYLEVYPTTNVTRPVVTLGLSGVNPTVSFPSAGSSLKYIVEKSTDGKSWTVLTEVPLSGSGTITHTDTTTTAGAPVSYRVYAL